MIALGVQDAKDNDAVAFETVEKFVRKTAGEQTTKATVVNRAALRVYLQHSDGAANFFQQFLTQTRPLGFIPQPWRRARPLRHWAE